MRRRTARSIASNNVFAAIFLNNRIEKLRSMLSFRAILNQIGPFFKLRHKLLILKSDAVIIKYGTYKGIRTYNSKRKHVSLRTLVQHHMDRRKERHIRRKRLFKRIHL